MAWPQLLRMALPLLATMMMMGPLPCAACNGVNASDPCGEGGVCVDNKCFCSDSYRHDDKGKCIKNPGKFAVYKSLCLAGVLLLVGKMLRVTVPLFQKTFLPASIIAGLLFFTVLQLLFNYAKEAHTAFTHEYTEGWSKIGAFAVDVLFSSLFLGTKIPSVEVIINKAGPQFLYNQLLNWGMWSAAVLTVLLICVPYFGSDPLLATLIPAGFTGGHAIIFAFEDNFSAYPDGLGLGLYISTVGQVASFVVGVMWINMASKKGLTPARPQSSDDDDTKEMALFAKGLFSPEAMPSAGLQTCSPDSMDVLTLHAGVVMLAMLMGTTCWEQSKAFLQDIGLEFQRFVWCMAMGIFLQLIYERLVDRDWIPPVLDPNIMSRLQGLLLDFLIVTAMSTLNVEKVLPQLLPATIASVAALLWLGLATWYLAPFFLPDHWFERAICEFGQTTGVISSGLILLKMCDPKQTLPVMHSFALKNFAAMPLMFTWLPFTMDIVASPHGLLKLLSISVAVTLLVVAIWYFKYRPIYNRVLGPTIREEGSEMVEKDRRKRTSNFLEHSTSFA